MMNDYLKNEKYFTMKVRKNLDYKSLEDFFHIFGVSKNKMNYLVENKCCYINGTLATYDTILKYNDYLMIEMNKFENLDYLPLDYSINVLYEDDYLLIVNKPAGYIIYPDNKSKKGTMANIIANYYIKNNFDHTIRHCHRLDKDTTGCLIYAKDLITQSAMEKMFEEKKIEKNYLAIVEGNLFQKNIITKSIGKDRHVNGKMIVTKSGKWAKTICDVIYHNQNFSMINVKIETGRTHQIRVHLSSINHPLYGDTLYGAQSSSRIMLHCYSIAFAHPVLGKKIETIAPIPSDFREIIKKEKLTCEN